MRLIRPDQHVCAATHRPSLWNLPAVAALLLLAGPSPVRATPITSAANIPYSGFAPGNVDMATGELIIVCPPDLRLDGPMPLAFERYYGSMLVREGFAAGRLGPNWLGSFDWSLSVGSPGPAVVTNRGQRLQFQANPVGGWDLVSPTDQKYRLDSTPGA